jgi:hypothetical protein
MSPDTHDPRAEVVAELRAQLAAAEARLAERIEHRDRCAADYRATSDGIAESMRSIELITVQCQLAPTDEDRRMLTRDRRRLMRLHTAAEEAAYAEFEERRRRWAHQIGEVTGPLKALPCGPNAELTALLMRHRIVGSYRYQPHRPVRKVTVLRIGDTERVRRSFTDPGDNTSCDSLADALAILATRYRQRLGQLCGDEQLTAALLTALNLSSSQPASAVAR